MPARAETGTGSARESPARPRQQPGDVMMCREEEQQ